MEKPITTALLAYGLSGKIFHAPFLDTHKRFHFYGVLERTYKKAILEYPKIKSFDTIDSLLSDETIELVVVNTPNHTHFDYAKQVLGSKKHVLIEKPATTTPEEFVRLLELAEKVNKKVFVYHNRRFSSDFMAAKQVIESGKLGNIIEVHLRFDRYRPSIGTKYFKETPIASSGIWYDLGSHLIDQAISLFGKPISHYRHKNHYRNNSLVDDFSFMHLMFKENINVFITTSMLVCNAQPGIVIHGTKGSFIKEFCDEQENQLMAGLSPVDPNFGKEQPNKEGKLTYYSNQNECVNELIPSLKGRFNHLFDEMYDTIRNNKPFSIDNKDIIEQLKLLV